MSNHSGSYMLNQVLEMLEQKGVLADLGQEKAQELLADTVRISERYDCNSGEILDGIGERVGICYDCLRPATDFDHGGMCRACDEALSASG